MTSEHSHSSAPQEAAGNLQAQQNQKQQTDLTNTAQGTLNQYEGPVQDSPFYKALLAAGTQSTNAAYNNAKSAARLKANSAGYGYEQPVTQGAEEQITAQQAGAQAALPGQALVQATQPSLEAANTTAGEAAQYGNQGLGYYNTASNIDEQRAQRAAQMWSSLASLGTAGIGAIAPIKKAFG